MTNYVIKTEAFEGPFDVLLSLIEKKKLHINEVSLAEIAHDYVEFVRTHEFHLKEASAFVVVAATLAHIKSKSLLPTFNLSDEEESDVAELQERLALFSIFTAVSKKVAERFGKKILRPRIYRIPKKQIVFTPDEQVTTNILESMAISVLSQAPQEAFIPEKKVERQMSLREVIDNISMRVRRFLRANFSELVMGSDKKGTAISFLAILELFKQGFVDLNQDEMFGEITVENTQIDTPVYGDTIGK